MQIDKLSPSNKTEPVSPSHSYKQDLTDDDEFIAAHRERGRAHMPKDISILSPEALVDSQALKIKLTVPLRFRKKPYDVSSTASRHATGAAMAKRGRPRKNKSANDEGDEYAPPRGFKPKSIVTSTTTQTLSSSAPPNRNNSVQVHHPPPDHSRYPTFLPASVLSSDDLSGSDDSELTDEDETDEEPYPEEKLVIDSQANRERARTHRELLGNDDDHLIPTRAPWKYNRHTKSNRHTPTANAAHEDEDVEGAGSSGNEEDDEKSDDEDDDEDEEDEVDADQPTPMQIETLSDDEDDKLDARLFFNNLLAESSGSEDEVQSDRDSVMGDIVVDAAESDTDTDVEVGQFEQPLMVKEGWDGELVFSTEIHPPPGLLDLDLLAAGEVTQLEDASQSESLANSFSTLPVTQPATVSDEEDEDNEEFEEVASEAGETTDDEIMPPSLVSLPFATTIAPHATFTPHKQTINLHQLNTSITNPFPSPSPADVLAGANGFSWDLLSSPVHSIATTDDQPPPRSRSLSVNSAGSRAGPRLGFFNAAVFGSKRTIIGDKPGKLPSPFSVLTPPAPVFRRKRRANSDLGSFFTKRRSNGGPPAFSYFSDDLVAPHQGQLVDLDDLLDASLLSDDVEKPPETDVQDASLSRWDRIPLGIYRQTRDAPATHGSSMSFSFNIGGFGPPLPRPEFVSPARSHVSHGSIDSILWDDEIRPPSEMRRSNHHHHNHNHGHNKKRHREQDLDDSLFLSPPPPRAGPSRGGDRTPTQPRAPLGDMSSEFLSEAKSRKDRRKEKKREKAGLRKQILSALDETWAEDYDDEMMVNDDITV